MAKFSIRRKGGRVLRMRWRHYILVPCGRSIKSWTAEGFHRRKDWHYNTCRVCRLYYANVYVWATWGRTYPQITGAVQGDV